MSRGGWSMTVGGGGAPSPEAYHFGGAPSAGPIDVGGPGPRFELADVRRLGRRLMRAVVTSARVTPPVTLGDVLTGHLGADAPSLPVVGETWPPYEHVNLQVALNHWIGQPGRQATLVGITMFQHQMFSLADLAQPDVDRHGPGVGSVAMTSLPIGTGGATMSCVRCGLYLVHEDDGPAVAVLLREGDMHGPNQGLEVQVACARTERSSQILAELRSLALEHNVFRGQVVAFESEMFGPFGGSSPLTFKERPSIGPASLVLPAGTLELIEQQVLGVARYRDRLLASGQHLKRGLLLYGPPGTGKTHTVRYLLSQLQDVTAVIVTGRALALISQACSIARALQPALVIIEDVDLIAEDRGMHPGQHPLLFQLLNEMDGLGDDVDVTFVLTTNRADLLEPALAARPGRVDEAVELPLPDAEGRLRLLQLYRGRMELRLSDPAAVVERTEGVTASFLKEVLRRAALHAAGAEGEGSASPSASASADPLADPSADPSASPLADPSAGPSADPSADPSASPLADPSASPLAVTDTDLHAALDQLLAERSRVTRVLLGGEPAGPNGPGGANGPGGFGGPAARWMRG